MQYKIGNTSGYLEITALLTNKAKFKRPRTEAICTCHKCGKEGYKILPYNFKKQKSCGCDRTWAAPPSGSASKLYKGFNSMPCRIIYNAEKRSIQKGLQFDLTQEFLWELFQNQNGKCKISGLPIKFGKPSEITASLDRIDSTKGYLKNNVQWLHKDINIMKNIFTTDYLISLCKSIILQNDLPKEYQQN